MDRSVERWRSFTLSEQMLNIGNEVKRAVRFDNQPVRKNAFLDNAIVYTKKTMEDPKNQKVMPELQIGLAVLEDYKGAHQLDVSGEQLVQYYMQFANFL